MIMKDNKWNITPKKDKNYIKNLLNPLTHDEELKMLGIDFKNKIDGKQNK